MKKQVSDCAETVGGVRGQDGWAGRVIRRYEEILCVCLHYLVVMVTWVYPHVQTYQTVYFKYVKFTLHQFFHDTAV